MFRLIIIAVGLFFVTSAAATEGPQQDKAVTTEHSVNIDGNDIAYRATAGTQSLTNDEGKCIGSIFYTAYIKESVTDKAKRPITFCFNGGPGSSSVWLHLGVFGPKRIDIDEEGKVVKKPYHLNDNPYSLLDITDLVFIDPISTGYSRAAPGEDPKQFYGVEDDIEYIAEFIRLFLTRNGRWDSPKYLAGESYGTTRASGLAWELHDSHCVYLDGIILISSVLNFQTVRFASGNDLPYILILPTYTATAHYHNMLGDEQQNDRSKTLTEAEAFAFEEYAHALMVGDQISATERAAVLDKLAKYTGIPRSYLDDSDLRVDIYRFATQLLKSERKIVGRFDSRLKGINLDVCSDYYQFDPSDEHIIGPFAAAFNNYVRTELNWQQDDEYRVFGDVHPWGYGYAVNRYLDVSNRLSEVMSKNTSMHVFVASGYYDMATPYFATDYTFAHMGLDPSVRRNVTIQKYDGGHMMYLYHPTLVQLKADLTLFFAQKT